MHLLSLAKPAWIAVILAITPAAYAQHVSDPFIMPPLALERGVATLRSLSEAELGNIFDKYATAAGGWYLEQRCRTFSAGLRQEFEWHLAQMTVMLGQIAKRDFLLGLQRAAQRTAANYPCSEEVTKTLILPTFANSKIMVKMLTDMEYSPAQQLMHDAQRTAHLLHGQVIDDQCRYMPAEIRTEYDGNVQHIIEGLTSRGGADAVAALRSEVQHALSRQPVNCDATTRQKLMTAFGESRTMTRR